MFSLCVYELAAACVSFLRMSQCTLRLDNFSFHAAADLSQNSKWMVEYDTWAFSLSLLDMMKQQLA